MTLAYNNKQPFGDYMFLRYSIALLIKPVLFSVLVFLCLRGVLLIVYPEYFAALTATEVAQAFVHGARFDISISTLLYALSLLGLMASVWLPGGQRVRKPILWVAFTLLAAGWLTYLGSIAFFSQVYRHLGGELLIMAQDTGFIIDLLFSQWAAWFAAAAILTAAMTWLWHSMVIKPAMALPAQPGLGNTFGFSLLALILAVIFARGFVMSGKPINIIDAYALGSEQEASLALNGAFSAIHSMRRANKNKGNAVQYFSEQELEAVLQQQPQVPLYRTIPPYFTNQAQPNVVMVLLESWSSHYIDALSGTQYQATPFMNSLIAKSAVWTRTYAAGQRSIEGIQAILTSIPLIEGNPVIGWGLEQNRMTTLANEANKLGYHSVFMQTSKRRSFHVDAIAGALGFNDYYGMEDFPALREYPEESSFGWDYEGLMFMADYLQQPERLQKPFFSFFFTGTSHEPFPDPCAEFHLYPHGQDATSSYLNTLRYSDWALEQFMLRMQEHPAYHNTVFIFVADHVLKASADNPHDSFHIPLIVYTPGQQIPAQRHDSIASQYDLLPTVASLLGIEEPVATFGHSLLTEPQFEPKGALAKQGQTYLWFNQQGRISFTATGSDGRAATTSESNFASAQQHWVQARLQSCEKSISSNRWVPIRH